MPDSKYGNMPNNSKKGSTQYSDTDSGKMGSNHGSTGSLKNAPAGGSPGKVGTMNKVNTKNMYPNGLA